MSLVEQALKKLQAARAARRRQWRRAAHRGRDPQRAVRCARAMRVRARCRAHSPHRARSTARPCARAGLLPPDHGRTRARQRIPPDQAAADRQRARARRDAVPNGHLIMVASALPGDGKTFTSINLALSMALEKDVSRAAGRCRRREAAHQPHVRRRRRAGPARRAARRERSTSSRSILDTDVPDLSILPAGKPSETATELLASARMADVVAQLGARRSAHRVVRFAAAAADQRIARAGSVRWARSCWWCAPARRRSRPCSMRSTCSAKASRSASCSTSAMKDRSSGYYGYYGQTAESSGTS